ncbi:MAG: ester cyclase [Anaerolineales bacterium]|nr:ester cyclase [Anaerolineales bacterium]MCB9172713.1 ester cyclase [Ardenticatenales bacterium]
MTDAAHIKQEVVAQLRRPLSKEAYRAIRREWIAHSIAEDARDIPGLMATLSEDCLYELPQTGDQWHGKEGATRFYTELLTAFPDVHFDLQNIVIGPQGVWEEAHVTGTHQAEWLGIAPTGEPVDFYVTILFPWDSAAQKFSGERVHVYGYDGFEQFAAARKARLNA